MARLNLKQYKLCFDRSPAAFTIIRVIKNKKNIYNDFVFEYANEALAKLEGIALDNLIGKHFYHIFYNADVKWLRPYGEAAFEGKTSCFMSFSPEVNKYLQVQCYQVDKGFCAVMLTDISRKIRFLNEELKVLVSVDESTMILYEINLNKDTCGCTFSKDLEEEGLHLKQEGKFSNLIKKLEARMVQPLQKKEFIRQFSVNNLSTAFKYGNRNMYFKGEFTDATGRLLCLQILVKLRQNPFTEELEGVLRMKNITVPVGKAKMLRNIVEEEYDYLSVLDVNLKLLMICYVNRSLPGELKTDLHTVGSELSYAEEQRFIADKWLMQEDRQEFMQKSALPKIISELRQNGRYIFYVRAVRDGKVLYKCFRYGFLNEAGSLIFIKQRDVSHEMHQLLLRESNTKKAVKPKDKAVPQAVKPKERTKKKVSKSKAGTLKGQQVK